MREIRSYGSVGAFGVQVDAERYPELTISGQMRLGRATILCRDTIPAGRCWFLPWSDRERVLRGNDNTSLALT